MKKIERHGLSKYSLEFDMVAWSDWDARIITAEIVCGSHVLYKIDTHYTEEMKHVERHNHYKSLPRPEEERLFEVFSRAMSRLFAEEDMRMHDEEAASVDCEDGSDV